MPENLRRARTGDYLSPPDIYDPANAAAVLQDAFFPAAFSPASLSPWLWLKAYDGVFKNAAKKIVPNNGEAIRVWEDKSGNGRDLSQATGSLQPTRVTGDYNTTVPGVRFINDWLQVAAASGLTGDLTVFLLLKLNVSSDSRVLDLRIDELNNDMVGNNLYWGSSVGGAAYNNNGRSETGTGYKRHTGIIDQDNPSSPSAIYEIYLDDTRRAREPGINRGIVSPQNAVTIGAYHDGSNAVGDFSIVELIIMEGQATFAQQDDVKSYFIALAATLPAAPTASFTRSPSSGIAPLLVNFTDTSTGSPTLWVWNFGDGSAEVYTQNPSHTFNTPGTYTVTLTTSNGGGNSTTTLNVTVTANPPVADFSFAPTSGAAPLTVNFTDLSTNTPTSWAWTFGDGGTSTSQNPSHTFNTPGTYTITLTATNSGGSDSESYNITVAHPVPVASFTRSPASGDAPLTVAFNNTSTNATSYSWDFGDGNSSTATSPSHLYTVPGTYTVTLTATGPGGTDTEQANVTVTLAAPVANFTATPTSGNAPLLVTFTNLSTGLLASYLWDFGDGTTSTLQHPTKIYTAGGTYIALLTVTNASGSSQYQVIINVIAPPPSPPPPVISIVPYAPTPVCRTEADYEIWVYHPLSGEVLTVLDGMAFDDLRLDTQLNDVGKFAMTLPETGKWEAIFPLDAFIQVRRRAPQETAFSVLETYQARLTHRFQENDEDLFIVGGVSLNHLLSRRIVDPDDDPAVAGGYSTKAGAGDTVMYQYAVEQVGATASAVRRIPNLVIPAPTGTGQLIGMRLRHENLLDVMQDMAKRSGIDFRMEHLGGAALRLLIGRIGDNKSKGTNFLYTQYVYLSPKRGNLRNPNLKRDRMDEKTYIYVRGQGQGTARKLLKVGGAGLSDSPFNRIEVAEDARNVEKGDPLGMLTSARSTLIEKGASFEFTADILGDEVGNRFGVDWQIGDTITVNWNEIEQDLRITGVEVSLSSSGEDIQVKVSNTNG